MEQREDEQDIQMMGGQATVARMYVNDVAAVYKCRGRQRQLTVVVLGELTS